MFITAASALILIAAQSGAPTAQTPPPAAETRIAQPGSLQAAAVAELKNPDGKTIGGAYFYDGPHGVLMRIEIGGITPGWHGVHLHEKGLCEAPGFQSAGGHFNPGKKSHGLLHPEGAEAGDLPSFHVEANGVGRTSLFTDLVSVSGAGGRPALLDADGASVVVHAGPDDQRTQPIGGSGDRIACGVLKKPEKK